MKLVMVTKCNKHIFKIGLIEIIDFYVVPHFNENFVSRKLDQNVAGGCFPTFQEKIERALFTKLNQKIKSFLSCFFKSEEN